MIPKQSSIWSSHQLLSFPNIYPLFIDLGIPDFHSFCSTVVNLALWRVPSFLYRVAQMSIRTLCRSRIKLWAWNNYIRPQTQKFMFSFWYGVHAKFSVAEEFGLIRRSAAASWLITVLRRKRDVERCSVSLQPKRAVHILPHWFQKAHNFNDILYQLSWL